MAATTERSAAWHWRVARIGVKVLALVVGAAAAYDSLPAFFMALAAIMVLLALASLFQSLRTAFADPGASSGLRVGLPERAALVDEKNALLRAIKDIAFEHEVGKLSEADFVRLDRAYRHRAKDVLRKLDEDLEPFLERAERLAGEAAREPQKSAPAARTSNAKSRSSAKKKGKKARAAPRRDCPACGTSNAADAAHCKECGAGVAPVECASCGTLNDADAKFCKKCASALSERSKPAAAELEGVDSEPAERDARRKRSRERESGGERSEREQADDAEDAEGDLARGDDA